MAVERLLSSLPRENESPEKNVVCNLYHPILYIITHVYIY